MTYDYESNPYYYPEKTGLVQIGAIDTAGSYEFDILCVWQHEESGKLYYATDSGCSCPSPFEDIESLDDMQEITFKTLPKFLSDLDDHVGNSYGYEDSRADGNKLAWEVINRVRGNEWNTYSATTAPPA